MIIRNLSSHIPMFTKIVVQNIMTALLLNLLNIQIGTGITNDVMTNTANSGPYGHSNACNSLKAISGLSNVYKAYTHSKKKKKNHVVATIINNRAIASKWSGLMYLSKP